MPMHCFENTVEPLYNKVLGSLTFLRYIQGFVIKSFKLTVCYNQVLLYYICNTMFTIMPDLWRVLFNEYFLAEYLYAEWGQLNYKL